MPAAPARPELTSALITVALLVAALVCWTASVFFYRHGINTNEFPSYLVDGSPNQVRRYSAPWIAGSVGIFGLGGLLSITGVGRIFRRSPAPSAVHITDSDDEASR